MKEHVESAQDDCAVGIGEALLVSRQPIFDREGDLWGYELMVDGAGVSKEGDAGASEAQDAAGLLASFLKAELSRKLFAGAEGKAVNCLLRNPPCSFLDGADFGECFGNLAVSVDAARECNLGDTLKSIRERDMIAVADAVCGTPGEELRYADIVGMSLERNTPQDVVGFRKANRGFPGKLLASDVGTWEGYQGTRALGFNYFQGAFFTKPENVGNKELSAGALTKLKLLGELNGREIEINRLAAVISADVALSYKLLQYINSAAFGLSVKVKSIQQAISLLGLREIKRWSIMVLISDLDSSPKGMELAYLSLQRGRFLESVCGETDRLPRDMKESMFLAGLFSNIDALLTCPMEQALETLPLDDAIKSALCGADNEYTPWLDLLHCIEDGVWDRARLRMTEFGIPLPKASANYLKASTWAADQLSGMRA